MPQAEADMSSSIRVLHLEDDPRDAEWIQAKLKAAGLVCEITGVSGKEAFEAALDRDIFDIVLSDYNLPDYDGMSAVRRVRDKRPELPVIVISGTVGEDEAVECLKAGATDYVLKQRPQRLGAAVRRALMEKAEQEKRREAENALRESELRYRRVAEQSPDAIVIHQDGKIVFANEALVRLMRAASAADLVDRPAISLVHPERRQVVEQRILELYAGHNLPLNEQEYVRLDGTVVDVEIASSPLMLEGKPAALVTVRDITERKEQEHRISRLSRIQIVLSGINSAIIRIRDRQELFQEACRIIVEYGEFTVGWISALDHVSGKLVPVAKAGLLLDLDAGGDSSEGPVGLVPAGTAAVALREMRPAFDNDIERGLGELNSESGPDTLSIRRAAVRLGAKSVIVLPLYVEGKTFGILTLYAPEPNFFDNEEIKLLSELAGDISFGLEFIAKEEKVDYLAYYDALTGLPNRSLFFDRFAQQLGTATRNRASVALVLMDLDRFRLINDTLGRQAGDALLNAVAQRIGATIRDQDTVARVGADRFAVAVSGKWRMEDVAHVLEARNDALFGKPFLLGNEELRVLATAGVAMFPGDGESPETLFANAEAAMRKAKQQNARVLFYGPEMNARMADSLRLENRLRRALDNGEMVLWYQPKVSARTREILGFEALMRWRDPESTLMVPPGQFIPLMEQTGLILEAGRWAMSQVARDCTRWAADGFKPPRVAVNVSPLQLRQKDFVATVVEAAGKTEEAGSMLDLEITESVIMENVEAIIPILQTVRGLGVEVAVDDFGTGYSSLAYIARLPVHDLKIDRSFVVGMTESEDSLTIVKAVISLAHSLRLNVVAEGVETEQQAALLLKLGCDQMQGYLISRPVPPEQVVELLRQEQNRKTDAPRRKASTVAEKSKGRKRPRRR
jgi:diguanylate cyclase (GGDEF)-like protein/PAS domain S-box-containing protein